MLFTSVDADTIEAQLEALLDGSFERQICDGCGHAYRPEHSLLFASHAHRLWIVMQPPLDRREFAALERGVERVIFDNFAQAPPVLTERLRGIRPRLVFGQHMLTEAVRASYLGIDPSLLECAKLLTVRRNLTELMMHGPFELCFERFEGSAPICAVHSLPHGERVAERALAVDILAEVRASQDELQAQFPDLFARPYMSATRYLIGDTV
jgi:hypothetical protein